MILGLPTYRVNPADRKPLVDFMLTALRAADCRILFSSEPDKAPFVITFETREGERLGIVAYAFLATRTPTKNRPADERSFQIKYGSKESYDGKNSHLIWQDPLGLFTTLFIGIDPAEGFFVAADPQMHNPSKFFIRLEFKDAHAEEIKRHRWHAWERERRTTKEMSEPVEILVGGCHERFLDLVRFERAAQGLSQGDRHLLAERPGFFSYVPSREDARTVDEIATHPLAKEFNLGAEQILGLISSARRLKMAVRGWVAEEHLRETISNIVGVTHCERLDDEGSPDLRLRYKDGPLLTVECKNVLRKTNREGKPRIDFQRTRASKSDPCTRYYAPADFDVIAGCLHAVTEKWEFRYALPMKLTPHTRCPGKIASNVVIGPNWEENPGRIFEEAYAVRGAE